MDFKQVIQASAVVIRITELKKNDVVKLIDDENDKASLAYGIVEDVLNDGEKGFVQLATIKKDYYGVNYDRKVISQSSSKQPAIFPASADEVRAYFDDARNNLAKRKQDAEKALEDSVKKLAEFDAMRMNESVFTSPKYSV